MQLVLPSGTMIETSTISERFSDNGETIYDFGDEFLVVCAKCSAIAKVLPINDVGIFGYKKLICSNCGYSKLNNVGGNSNRIASIEFSRRKNSDSYIVIGGAFDWYFRLPLWLQIECGGKTLWAYNQKHLEFIENYVSAKLRQRTPNTNKSLASRLPQWIKRAKNRDEVLRAIGKLKEKLNGKS
jgi:hypothetical protein